MGNRVGLVIEEDIGVNSRGIEYSCHLDFIERAAEQIIKNYCFII